MEHFEIAKTAEKSADFRRVLWTGEHTQLVIMTIPPGGEIGVETHDENDQILSFVSGLGKAVVDGTTKGVGPGDIVIVPAGVDPRGQEAGGSSLPSSSSRSASSLVVCTAPSACSGGP